MKIVTSLSTLAALVLGSAFVAPASAQTANCDPTIQVNGRTVHIVQGLPVGKCSFKRTIALKGTDCPSGIARVEPMSEEALRKHPVKPGEDAGYHFVCLPRVDATTPPPALPAAPAQQSTRQPETISVGYQRI